MKLSAFILFLVALSLADGINPVVNKGHKFFDATTGKQFLLRGVAYQPRGLGANFSDPLANPTACTRDIALMQPLGINAIRVYEVNNALNHDACMSAFSSAGIYLILDLATVNSSINRNAPRYDVTIWDTYKATIDAFVKYDNTLAFFAGNEVTSNVSTASASSFVKAAVRDVKAYLSKKSLSKTIYVGYAGDDDPDVRASLLQYFNCGPDDQRVDFFGMNLYEWCGDSTFQSSGFAARTQELASYSIPVILSEYGCNIVEPRVWGEIAAIYSSLMWDVWSGGLAYEWTQEDNNYGLVEIDAQGNAKPRQDYTNLQKVLSALPNPLPTTDMLSNFTENRPVSNCPASSSFAASSSLPPTPSDAVCSCMVNSLSCAASSQASADPATVGAQFGIVCGLVSCADIQANGSTGAYGNYSFCKPADQLSYMYNQYYLAQNKNPGACNFAGNAQLTNSKSNTDSSSCLSAGGQFAPPSPGSGGATSSASSLLDQGAIFEFLLRIGIALFVGFLAVGQCHY